MIWKKTKVDFLFASLLILTIYLALNSNSSIFWLIASIILTVPIINQPWLLLYSLMGLLLTLLSAFLVKQPILEGPIEGYYRVKHVTSTGAIITVDKVNVLVRTSRSVNKWDWIFISGEVEAVKNTSTFDFVSYMKSLNVRNIIVYSKVTIIAPSNDFRIAAYNYLTSGGDHFSRIAPLLLLGIKNEGARALYERAIELNVVHLFVISGFHLSILYFFLQRALTKMGLGKTSSAAFSLLPLIFYLFMLDFPLSATRAFLLITFGYVNKYILHKHFCSLQIISLIFVLMLIWKPYNTYSLSFIYTFVATFTVIYISAHDFKFNEQRVLTIAISVYLVTIPISIYQNNFWSIFGLFFGIALLPLFALMFLLTLVLFPFRDLLNNLYIPFDYALKAFGAINITIDIPQVPLLLVQITYLIPITYLIISKRWNFYTDPKITWLSKRLKR